MSPRSKKILYNGIVGGIIASYIFFKVATVHAASLDPLLPVTSCGEMDLPGIYIIDESFTAPADSHCFTVQADNVTIIGTTTTPTVTGSSAHSFITVAIDPLTGSPYGTTTIENLNVDGFSQLIVANGFDGSGGGDIVITDVSTSGNIYAYGGYTFEGTGGAGGTITLTNSTSGSIYAPGGFVYTGTGGNGGTVTLTNSTSGNIRASGVYSLYGTAGTAGTVTLTNSTSGNIRAFGANSQGGGAGGTGGTITLIDSTSGSIYAYGGSSYSGTGGTGGTITLTNSTSGNIRVPGGNSQNGGAGGAGGTISLTSSTSGSIYAPGGYSSLSSEPGGAGGIVTLTDSTSGTIVAYAGTTSYGIGGAGGTVALTNSTSGDIRASGGSTYTITEDGGTGGTVALTNSTSGDIRASGGFSFGTAGNGGDITLTNSTSGNIYAIGGSSLHGTAGNGGTITLTDSTSGYITAHAGTTYGEKISYGTEGTGGAITLTDSTSGNITAFGENSYSGTGGTGGTITLTDSTSGNIRAFGGGVSFGIGEGGTGGSITLTNSTSGYLRAYGGPASLGTGGTGGTVGLTADSTSGNIFAYGGASYSGTGGTGGTITLTNSTSGNIYAIAGSSYSGTGGIGGAINISGTNMRVFSTNPILSVLGFAPGTITVEGSILFDTDDVWTGDASDWLGTSTWTFQSNSENQGTVKGNADFRDTSINQSGAHVAGLCQLFDDSVNNGTCDTVVFKYGYFFSPVNSEDWDDPLNWFVDPGALTPLGFAPTSTDETIYLAGTTTGPTATTTVGSIKVADNKTGGGIFGVDISKVIGFNSASFFNGGFNTGIINGIMKVLSSTLGGFSNINQGGLVTGDVEFYNDTYNDTNTTSLIGGIAKFFDTSYNAITGVLGIAQFNDTSENRGTVETGTFNDSSSNTSTGEVADATFNDSSTSLGTFDSGTFNDSSYNDGVTSGDATFESGTRNAGTVLGDATFQGDSYNIGTTTNATFVGEYSENFNGSTEGVVTNIKTRLYNATNQQYNLLRNFADSAWTIVADNTFVKLLYRTLIDLLPGSPTETTLVEQNGGAILAPTLGTTITGCAVLDTASTTYVLQNNITNFKYDTCFIVMADNITLDANNKIIDALASADTTAIVTASTTATTTGASAYTNFTLKNATLTDFDVAVDARGQNNTNGTGGDAGTLAFDTVILRAGILADGGNGTLNGGNAGDISLLDTTTKGLTASTTISINGGDSTSCGVGGNGGNLDSIDSEFDLLSADAGSSQTSGCTPEEEEEVNNSSGSRINGGVRTNTGTYTPPSSGGSTGGEGTPGENTGGNTSGNTGGTLRNIIRNTLTPLTFTPITPFTPFTPNFNPVNIGATVIPDPFQNFQPPGIFNLVQLPVNFLTNISRFLFAPLPNNLTNAFSASPRLAAYMASVGVSKEQDIAHLTQNPARLEAPLSDEVTPPGLFIIRSGETTLTSYATYDASLGGLAQLVKVSPNQSLHISLIPQSTGQVTATYLGQTITFTQGSLFATTYVQTPSTGGRYILKTPSSSIPLLIDVIEPLKVEEPQKQSIFIRIWNWIKESFAK